MMKAAKPGLVTLIACACTALPALAQATRDSIPAEHDPCERWVSIPGFSDPQVDTAYSRCMLDAPARLIGTPAFIQPRSEGIVFGSIQVVVNPDGTVNPRLTRLWSRSSEDGLEHVLRWRFEPGRIDGISVRTGFTLHYRSDARNDTLPSRLEWRYQPGAREDSLIGTWHLEHASPPLTSEDVDTVFVRSIRRLIAMRVILPWLETPYCLAADRWPAAERSRRHAILHGLLAHASSSMDRRMAAWYRATPASPGCASRPEYLRVIWRSEHRTENGRVVTHLAGDYLEQWPPGLDGRPWRAWNARCVVHLNDPPGSPSDCDVHPIWTNDPAPTPRNTGDLFPGESARDSLRVAVIVTTLDAFQRDTLHAVATRLASWTNYGSGFHPPPAVRCADDPDCTGVEGLGPADIDLARQGHIGFRLGDLRPETRAGIQLRFRIHTNGAGPPHRPLVVVRLAGGMFVWWPSQLAPNTWEYAVNSDFTPDSYIRVYLVPG